MKWFDRLYPRRTDVPEAPAEPSAEPAPTSVAGDRGILSVNRTRSLQSRVSNLLAVGLMSVLGVGLLVWYYTQTATRRTQAREAGQASTTAQAQGEMPLPAIGPIDPSPPAVVEDLLGPPPEMTPAGIPATDGTVPLVEYGALPPAYPVAPAKTAEELAFERRLSGAVLTLAQQPASSGVPPAGASDLLNEDPAMAPEVGGSVQTPAAGSVAGLLKPTTTPAARARVLPTQRLLLPKGAFIDCTLETAIDSSLPGLTTCITATDTFSVDGHVVLLERGTKLVGETRGEMRQGQARVFVLWTEARTPTGVVVPLDSPGTDELGRAGLPGMVNRHFFERFGAAILISVIDGAIQKEVQSESDGGTVIYNPSGTQDIMTEVLKSTVNIPPTVTKRHGDRIQVLVARDLDFRTTYELRPAAASR